MQNSIEHIMQVEGVTEEEKAAFEGVMAMATGALGQAQGTLGGSITFEQGNIQVGFYVPFEAVQTTVVPLMGIIPQIIKLRH